MDLVDRLNGYHSELTIECAAELIRLRRELEQLKEHFAKLNAQDVETNNLLRRELDTLDRSHKDLAHRLAEAGRDNERLRAALEGAKRCHLIIDDCWYSCPKSGECCNDMMPKDFCSCGADQHNADIDAAIANEQGAGER